ncbi:P-loop containing nucleoside triphosphate hydrolase protein [Obelidium mucronatum]|nr:P-loop containing nucleoside triphosphate hydrolase protein [Obelidium mucronatum]
MTAMPTSLPPELLAAVRNEHELMLTAESYILERVPGLSSETLRNLKLKVAKEFFNVPMISVADSVLYEEASWHVVSSGCPGIDQLLEFNGFATGTITEFAGLSSTGKTQLALFSILTSLCLTPGSTALLIDSNCSFCPIRTQQLFDTSDRFQLFRDKGMTFQQLSKRFHVSRCYDAFELLDCLNGLQHRIHGRASEFEHNLKLLVLDSVGSLLAPIVGTSSAQSVLVTLSLILRALSKAYAIPVITLNHAVQVREHERVGQNTISMKPALGSTWAQTPTQTLFFTDPSLQIGVNQKESSVWEFENRKGETVAVARKRVEVLKGKRVALGTWRYLYIGKEDIICFPEQI